MDFEKIADVIVTSSVNGSNVSKTSDALANNVSTMSSTHANDSDGDSSTGGWKLIGDKAVQYIFTINYATVCAVICVFGIAANVINIIVFVKVGFKETINIALMALSVTDLFSLVSLLWSCLCLNPLLMYSDLPFYTVEIQHKSGSWTHIIFIRITAFITVYITLERCLCVVFPLKIKQMLTPKRVFAIIVGIFVFIFASMIPNYATVKLVRKFIPARNRTMFGFAYIASTPIIQAYVYYLNAFLIIITFITVISCSSVLIWKLNERSRWLNEAVSDEKKSNNISRDTRVIKMVVCVAIVFIFSFMPSVINFMAMAAVSDINVGKRHQNLFFLLASFHLIGDAINSSANIFVYYRMSSKYNEVFRSLFSKRKD